MYDFTEEEINRYSRHILLQDVGVEGQEKIKNAKVLIVGAGGLGAPIALYLAAAGVGTIGIIDYDVVDISNLQRQVIHFTEDVGRPKVLSAKEKINRINPNVNVVVHQDMFVAANALDLVKDYDFIVDGTDNFPVKFLINDACVMAGKPFSHGGIQQPTTSRPCADVLASRRARCHCRYARHHTSRRDAQILHRRRRPADEQTAHVQRQNHGLQEDKHQTVGQMPNMRREPNNHKTDRLRAGRMRPQEPLIQNATKLWQT